MARRRNRARAGKWADAGIGILLGSLGIVLLIALGGAAWWFRHNKPIIDEATLCPKDGPHLVQVIIFDRTDPITPLQGVRIKQHFAQLVDAASAAQRFDIYTVEGDSKHVLTPVLGLCSPGRGKDANELYQNPDLIERQFRERFAATLEQTVNQLLQESTRPSSPVIESMKASAIESFGAFENAHIPLRMTIISDLVQHTPLYSQIRSESTFADLSRSAAWRSLQPNLRGAEVTILYLLRPTARRPAGGQIQNRGHQLFWEQLIAASNGRLVSFEPI